MGIIFIGSGHFALPALKALQGSPDDICCVLTQPDRPTGRGQRLSPTPVKRCALDLGLQVFEVPNINDAAVIGRARACQATLAVVIAFGQKIGPAFRSTMPGGCINLHASLLPNYRGAAPLQWAIIRGESLTGLTVFKIVDRMDAGPILKTVETRIGETETAAELHDRLAELGPAIILDVLALFAAGHTPDGSPQNDALATAAPKFKKTDGRIDFAAPADLLVRWINGLWSWPGAACRFASADGKWNERIVLARARVGSSGSAGGEPGVLTENLHVSTRDGGVEILDIKPQSGKRMDWQAYVNGRHVQPGDRFVPGTA